MLSMKNKVIQRLLRKLTNWLGNPTALYLAVGLIVGWIIAGMLLGFSDSLQLIINTITSVITFLMCFVIQNSQNRDGRAIQIKLDALIAALEKSSNKLIGLEEADDKELDEIQSKLNKLKD